MAIRYSSGVAACLRVAITPTHRSTNPSIDQSNPVVSNSLAQWRVVVLDEQTQLAIRNSVTEASHQTLATASDALRLHPWIAQELFDETRRLWSKAYGRVISEDEVIEILVNVRRLAEALLHACQNRRVA